MADLTAGQKRKCLLQSRSNANANAVLSLQRLYIFNGT